MPAHRIAPASPTGEWIMEYIHICVSMTFTDVASAAGHWAGVFTCIVLNLDHPGLYLRTWRRTEARWCAQRKWKWQPRVQWEESGSKVCVLPVPAQATSSQVGQIRVEVGRQATEAQRWLCEGGRARKVHQGSPGSPTPAPHSQPHISFPFVRTCGFLSPCLWPPSVTGWRLQVWELFWSKYRKDWCSTRSASFFINKVLEKGYVIVSSLYLLCTFRVQAAVDVEGVWRWGRDGPSFWESCPPCGHSHLVPWATLSTPPKAWSVPNCSQVDLTASVKARHDFNTYSTQLFQLKNKFLKMDLSF